MIPQKVIITQQKRVLNLLLSPNPEGFTRMQLAKGLGIERATICRRVAELRDLGLVCVVKKDICPITHEKAEFLTANREVISSLPAPSEQVTEQTGSLF